MSKPIDDIVNLPGFDTILGLVYTATGPDEVTAYLDPRDDLRQPYGLIHGGVYCAVVESLGSIGASLHARSLGMFGAVGMSNSTDFLRSHRDGRLHGVATPIHQSRTQQLWLVEISRESDGKTVGRGQLRAYNLRSAPATGGAGSG